MKVKNQQLQYFSRTQTGVDSLPTMYQSPLIFVFEIDPQRLALSDFPLLSYQIISFLMSLLSALKTLFKSRLSGVGIASYWYSYVVDSKSYVVLVLLIVLANSSSPAAFDPPKERNKTSTREKMTSVLVQNICFACESEKVVLSLERERILPNGEKNKASKEMSNAIDSLKESSILVTLRHQNSSPPYHYVVYAIEIRPKLWLTTKVTSGLHPEVSG